MSGLFERIAGQLVNNRSKLPRWARKMMELPARKPDGFVGRLAALLLGSGSAPVTSVPDSEIRVYIAPTNYAGQGYLWARALERADQRIGAQNMAVRLPGGFAFAADTSVPIAAVNASQTWAEAEWEAARRFTHVLVEAERSMFGQRFDRNVEREIEALERSGLSVAFLCHGTDIRNPAAHRARTPWSPYPEDPRTELLQGEAETNLQLLQRSRLAVFVSTPDLLLDVPWASWCPVVVDEQRFASSNPVLQSGSARVIHASSDPLQKGSDRIQPALSGLIDSKRIEFELVSGVASEAMPRVIGASDIVLDQFRLGSYGVAACEAMAAGRVVVGHVLPEVRHHIEVSTGWTLPIVEATPDTLGEVITELISDPARSREIAEEGRAYVSAIHSGERSAQVLIDEWIAAPNNV
ncbi:MAG: hypothetical protein LCH36_02010 [Actinobacteria bacterium]|nr:hypothetical protein [Actinomycetota bacterium]